MREKFRRADLGITGGNFLIAETGTSIIVTNEGNGDLTQSLPKIHIVIASIEKIVPTLEDAATILRVLARSATGQDFSNYTTLSTGAPAEAEGREEFVDAVHAQVHCQRIEVGVAGLGDRRAQVHGAMHAAASFARESAWRSRVRLGSADAAPGDSAAETPEVSIQRDSTPIVSSSRSPSRPTTSGRSRSIRSG